MACMISHYVILETKANRMMFISTTTHSFYPEVMVGNTATMQLPFSFLFTLLKPAGWMHINV